ncbi:MAG: hypothetical protein JHC88_00480 [Niveispirillum sp.]|nr:hypothetical protein [Niveispirillum sp.]
MRHFTDITDAFAVADGAVSSKIDNLLATTNMVPADVAALSQITANAYFFMVFARFESAVKELTKQRIEQMRQHAAADDARAWGVISHDALFFLNHVALLTDKGGSDYRDVQELYKDRNAIAHGKFAETKPNVPVIAAKLSGILSRLEGIP